MEIPRYGFNIGVYDERPASKEKKKSMNNDVLQPNADEIHKAKYLGTIDNEDSNSKQVPRNAIY